MGTSWRDLKQLVMIVTRVKEAYRPMSLKGHNEIGLFIFVHRKRELKKKELHCHSSVPNITAQSTKTSYCTNSDIALEWSTDVCACLSKG